MERGEPRIDDGKITSSLEVEVTFSGCLTAQMTEEGNTAR